MSVHLSPRERQIVELIGRDLESYQGVAKKLSISPNTVRNYVNGIAKRLGSKRPAKVAIVMLWRRLADTDGTVGDALAD